MNTDTHEFWQEIYPASDRELKPPTSRYVHPGYSQPLVGPWTIVSVAALAGHASGLFHDGKPSHVVVVWAREKK